MFQITALRKCELRIVQSSRKFNKDVREFDLILAVIGSILSKLRTSGMSFRHLITILTFLVLVLGMCFFAGGLRFSEQGFDQSEVTFMVTIPK
jgi:Ca2+:H+ antiporter